MLDKMTGTNSETLKQLYHLSKHLRYSLADLIFSLLSETKMEKPRENLKLYKDFYIRKSGSHDYKIPEVTVRELYDKYVNYRNIEHREDQLRLANEIFSHFEKGEHLAIEAYTGVGKTSALQLQQSVHSLYDERFSFSSRKIYRIRW